jgi:RND family efflux transporter MFP subunit
LPQWLPGVKNQKNHATLANSCSIKIGPGSAFRMTAPLAHVLQHIRRLVHRSATMGLTDGEILERFVRQQDEAAFEELLARHGPMVLAVCRQLLRDPHDAEDAFQATFLVLVRRAASISKPERLAGWLYGVAHRVAWRARTETARRRARERQGTEVEAVAPPGQMPSDDMRPLVHEEVNRLPEKYRTPVVLCYLEGKTHEEAAKDLGCTQGVLKGRLERARNLLRKRLLRRGLTLSAGALPAVLCPSGTAVPPALATATVKAALLVATGQGLVAGVVSTHVISLMEGVVKIMFLAKLKIAAAVVVVAGVVGAGVAVSAYHSLAAEQPAPKQTDDPKQPPQDSPPKEAREEKPKEAARAESPLPKVEVIRPLSRQVVDHQYPSGRVDANKVDIYAQTNGLLLQVFFQAGAEVNQGDRLFATDPRQYQIEVDKAKAELMRAEARLNLLGDSPARAEYKAAVQVAQANLELAKLQLDSTTITAPISGHIGRPLVTPGTYVKAGTTLLTTIVATEPLYVEFDIDTSTYLALQRPARESKFKLLGATVSLCPPGERNFPLPGTIDYVGNQTRLGTSTLPVRALIAKPHPLLVPGMSLSVRLPISEPHAALLVPRSALTSQPGQGQFVLVATDRNVVERRRVQLAEEEDGWYVIKNGLHADDWIILNYVPKLHDGMAIKPEPVSGPKPPKE